MTRITGDPKLEKFKMCRGSSLVERRPEKAGVASSILAPGTTHACKNLFPEEVYVSVGFKADLSIFLGALKCELSDLLREECPRLMDRRRVRQ